MTRFIHDGKVIKTTRKMIFKRVYDKIIIKLHQYMVIQFDATKTPDGGWDIKIIVMSTKEIKNKYTANT